jgi:hypothetical protein
VCAGPTTALPSSVTARTWRQTSIPAFTPRWSRPRVRPVSSDRSGLFIVDVRRENLSFHYCACDAEATGGDEHNLDLSLGSSAGSKRGSLDGGGDEESSDQHVPMAFDLDWQTAAARSTKAKVSLILAVTTFSSSKERTLKNKKKLIVSLASSWTRTRSKSRCRLLPRKPPTTCRLTPGLTRWVVGALSLSPLVFLDTRKLTTYVSLFLVFSS